MSPALVGEIFAGRYRIEEQIGAGGMGTVYRAEHIFVGRQVALKLLRQDVAEDEGVRERFLTEPKQAAKTRHPNIIPIYDAGSEDGQAYIAMECVEGGDLHLLLQREGPLDPERALAIISQVAGALDAAHERGIVHRDVKPANILVASGGHVYLTDFGIAKDAALAGRSRKDAFLGTIQYAAPEQIRRREVDARADVYALGCVLYHCLAGGPPFECESEFELMNAHVQEPPPRLSAARPGLPPGLDHVLLRALAKEPGERYASCSELVSDARASLSHSSAVAAALAAFGEPEPAGTVPEEEPVPPAGAPVPSEPEAGKTTSQPEAGGTVLEHSAGRTTVDPQPAGTTIEPEAGKTTIEPAAARTTSEPGEARKRRGLPLILSGRRRLLAAGAGTALALAAILAAVFFLRGDDPNRLDATFEASELFPLTLQHPSDWRGDEMDSDDDEDAEADSVTLSPVTLPSDAAEFLQLLEREGDRVVGLQVDVPAEESAETELIDLLSGEGEDVQARPMTVDGKEAFVADKVLTGPVNIHLYVAAVQATDDYTVAFRFFGTEETYDEELFQRILETVDFDEALLEQATSQ